MTPWMWIIGGPNGAGKSSFAGQFLIDLGHRDLLKLNADERTLDLRVHYPDWLQSELNRMAAEAVDRDVVHSIEEERSFVVETVLSSPKYRDDVLTAKAKGFKVGLIYVSLYPPELSPQRVSERAAKGGHDVEAAKAIARHYRSHEELRWFAPQADIFMAFDNSSRDGVPVLVASRAGNEPLKIVAKGINPAIDGALAAMPPPPNPATNPG